MLNDSWYQCELFDVEGEEYEILTNFLSFGFPVFEMSFWQEEFPSYL